MPKQSASAHPDVITNANVLWVGKCNIRLNETIVAHGMQHGPTPQIGSPFFSIRPANLAVEIRQKPVI
ncbi:MAG TPA: hypothetical protein VF938_03090, partial [Candidatus Angelobacter sp.]